MPSSPRNLFNRRPKTASPVSAMVVAQVSDVPIELITVNAGCAIIGGDRPINRATYYRGVAAGIYPAPVKVAPNIARIVRPMLLAALRKLIDKQKAPPSGPLWD